MMTRPNPAGHTCHAYGCEVPVPPRMLMCRRHWYQVPRPLRKAVWAAYRPGQEVDKAPSDAYLQAAMAAVNAVDAARAEERTTR